MKRSVQKAIAFFLLLALMLAAAGCGEPQKEAPPEETPEPTPHVHLWDGGVCAACGEICAHQWRVGLCTICGAYCEHQWQDGVCAVCGLQCPHVWKDGACAICGEPCEHLWSEGVCARCGAACPHERHDAETLLCGDCGKRAPHEYLNGVCERCGAKPVFVKNVKLFPAEAAADTEHRGTVERYHFPLYEGEILPGARGTKTVEERRMRDMVVYTPYGYDESRRYDVLILTPGAGHSAHQWMEKGNVLTANIGRIMGRELLDAMIDGGFIEPLIVVEVEYYLRGEPEDVAVEYGIDLRERVLPFLAEHYATYASLDENGCLIPAPEHFAIEGASFGAMILWQLLPNYTDLFSYWGMLSGAFKHEEELAERINSGVEGTDAIRYLYTGDGKDAIGMSAYKHRIEQLDERCPCIEQGGNLCFIVVQNAAHNYAGWDVGLYNSLQLFFHSRWEPASTETGA